MIGSLHNSTKQLGTHECSSAHIGTEPIIWAGSGSGSTKKSMEVSRNGLRNLLPFSPAALASDADGIVIKKCTHRHIEL